MPVTRWLALTAALGAAVLMCGLSSHQASPPASSWVAAPTSLGVASQSIDRGSGAPTAVTAVEADVAPILTRTERRQPLRVTLNVLTFVMLACAAALRHGRGHRTRRDPVILPVSAFCGPTPGRRAPPRPRIV
jgi:hypothetical protein